MPTQKDPLQTGQHQHKGLSDDSCVGHASTPENSQKLSSTPGSGSLQNPGRGRGALYLPPVYFSFAPKRAIELVKPHVPIWGLQKAALPIKPAYSQGIHTLETTLTSGPLGSLIKPP